MRTIFFYYDELLKGVLIFVPHSQQNGKVNSLWTVNGFKWALICWSYNVSRVRRFKIPLLAPFPFLLARGGVGGGGRLVQPLSLKGIQEDSGLQLGKIFRVSHCFLFQKMEIKKFWVPQEVWSAP